MFRQRIRRAIEEEGKEIFGIEEMPEFSVDAPENPEHGDYAANAAMALARILKKNPMDVANALIRGPKIGNQELWRTEIAAPGFINFFLDEERLIDSLSKVIGHPEQWGESDVGAGKTAILDYFQLNIAKRPHIGHIRSAIIGDALKRMLLSQGCRAVSDTHVGDWGTQFGILLYAYKEKIKKDSDFEKRVRENPFDELEKLYQEDNQIIGPRTLGPRQRSPEWEKAAEDYFRERDSRMALRKREFAKLEQGDQENRRIWEWMVDVSMKNLERSANRLGLLPFDEHRGESFYEDKMRPIVELALAKGTARKKEDGAITVDLAGEGLDEAVLIKSDGASTYLLRDLATIRYRKEAWNFWKNLYVVDVRQSHHFRQLFRVAELLGFEGVGQSEHVSYGFWKTPKGSAVSTRGGTGISLEKVIDEAVEKARAVIREKNPDLENAEAAAQAVGIGALKYFDLSHHRNSDVVFTWERALSFEGNTGPYVQYAHARLKSILRKAGVSVSSAPESAGLDPAERALLAALFRFPEAIEDALAIWSPHALAAYLYALAKQANEFYHAFPVLQERDEKKKMLRLALVAAGALTIKSGLSLLGIDAPDEM